MRRSEGSRVTDQPPRLVGADIICLGYGPWHGLHGFLHHVIDRLSAHNRVLYVEGAPPWVRARAPRLIDRTVSVLANLLHGLERVSPNLHVLHPSNPGHITCRADALDRHLLVDRVRHHKRRLGFRDPILWCAFPTGAHLAGRLDERLVLYQCLDDYGCVPGVKRSAVRDLEDDLLAKADLVLAASGHLFRQVMQEHPNAYYMPVAVDTAPFAAAADGDAPADVTALPRPVLGYIGSLSAPKVDVELIAAVARAHPSWSVCLIGPITPQDRAAFDLLLGGAANVHFLGRKAYDQVPACYAAMDAVLLPYRINEHTRAIFPPQFIEALAAGKPVVITELDAVEHYRLSPTLCHVARDRAAFLRSARQAVAEKRDPATIALRRNRAERHALDARIADIESLILHTLARHRPAKEEVTRP